MRFDIRPDKVEEYAEWVEKFYRLTLDVRGVEEFRAYRTKVSSQGHVIVTYEFKNMEAWAKWYENEELQKFLDELRKYVTNMTSELWGSSPIVPKPIHPENK